MSIEPESWSTKPANTVLVKFFGGTEEQKDDVKAWVEQYLTEENDVFWGPQGNYSMFMNMGGDNYLTVEDGQYVYLDEDGFHVASKGAFEMYYKKDAPPA